MEILDLGSTGEEKPRPRHATAGEARTRDADPAAPESDKDSGYSDVASECLSSVEQTDADECVPSSHWSTTCPPSHHPPLLLLKNLLVDQGSRPDPHLQSWAVHPSFQLLPTSSQILVFPPSVPSTKPQPVCKKSTKYLPILNSYTKIAPHPSQLSSSATHPNSNKRAANPSHHSQAKRLASGLQHLTAKGNAASAVRESREPKLVLPSEDVSCCELDLTSPPKGTDEMESADRGDPRADRGDPRADRGDPRADRGDPRADRGDPRADRGDPRADRGDPRADRGDPRPVSSHSISHSDDGMLPAQQHQNKSRRFHNTLDVLRRSGLLTIAMKTKELARLNQATQVQLERLQEQVAVYSKAVCSNNPDDWQMLHHTLAGSHRILGQIDM